MSKWTIPPEGGHMDKPSGIYFQTMTKKASLLYNNEYTS